MRKKSFITFLENLNKKHGKHTETRGIHGDSEITNYNAFIIDKQANELIDENQKEISELQDKIDEINATTFIEFEE